MIRRLAKPNPLKTDLLSEGWIDVRLVSTMRLTLAASALLVSTIDPPTPTRYSAFTYVALALYTIYSASFYIVSLRESRVFPAWVMPWLDLAWFLTIVAFSGGASSIFFNFLFFPILVASFGWGYTSGLRLTLASAVLFTIIAFLTAPALAQLELNRLMLAPIQLLILGFLISRWGGFKMQSRNRLQLLKDITVLSNPRFGIDKTIRTLLEILRAFYDADACLLLMEGDGNHSKSHQLYRVIRGKGSTGFASPEISSEAANLFLLPSREHAIIYRKNDRIEETVINVESRETFTGDAIGSSRVATVLETDSYLSVPMSARHQMVGRLYVIGGTHQFDTSAIDFVLQLMDYVTPVLENIRLVDHLAFDAAEQERRRIGLDIHDSVIQPYMGLQLGISALARKLDAGNVEVLADVKELLALTKQELAGLRHYVWELRAGEERRDVLLPAIHRYAASFTAVTGINVQVKASGTVQIKDRLAAELFQIVTEGLSNVRRHALCDDALVEIALSEGMVQLKIKNSRPRPSGNISSEFRESNGRNISFTPRSISERATLLGGETKVFVDENNYTVVSVEIPA